jgi:hypothetical protein
MYRVRGASPHQYNSDLPFSSTCLRCLSGTACEGHETLGVYCSQLFASGKLKALPNRVRASPAATGGDMRLNQVRGAGKATLGAKLSLT